MRILAHDQKEGLLRLSLQTLEDLWHLHKILEEGDLVEAKTYRKVAIKHGHEIDEGEKRPVNLTIRLERSEFHQYTGKLRLAGTIVSGPPDIQLASKHTISLEPGMLVTVKKKAIKSYQIDRLRKARVKEADIFFVALDRDQADFAELKEFGLQMRGSISYTRRQGEEDRSAFYDRIAQTLLPQDCRIVVCGPGFERTNLYSYLRKRYPDLAARATVEHASDIGEPGIREVLATTADKLLKESRLARETAYVERLLLEVRKRGLAAVSRETVEQAISYGAVETLLVSDTKVREAASLIDDAERVAATVVIISGHHPAGEQLLALGGVGAILRFAIGPR
ncbi:MAG: mRNA surveillance protein pelota [Candidatus Aenigmarchaeota archaeon]|nr:mRNA surveillance protein pelota [Candidatus Aenigmarchaeota archaeon]